MTVCKYREKEKQWCEVVVPTGTVCVNTERERERSSGVKWLCPQVQCV